MFCYTLGWVLQGNVTITTIDLSCVKIMSVKLHSEYRILWALLCASFALFGQKQREWQNLSACFFNTPHAYWLALPFISLVNNILDISNCVTKLASRLQNLSLFSDSK